MKSADSTDIIFVRTYHSLKDEFGHLAAFGYVEVSNALLYLAAMTRHHGYNTKIIDALALKLETEKLAKLILEQNPKYVGITSVTMDIFRSHELAKLIKEANPNITVINGGPHMSAAAKETMERMPYFDIGVIGEAEGIIIDLLDTLEGRGKAKLMNVNGLIYRERGDLKMTAPASLVQDLDTLPVPAWDLLPDMKKFYFAPAWTKHGGQAATIITSRGCPYKCTYCDRSVFGNKVRYHGPKYTLNMIRTLKKKYGIGHFRIGDDNFIMHRERLAEICQGIIREKLEVSWSCLSRADLINEKFLEEVKQAGCWSIAFGIESGSQKIHDFEKKKMSLERIAEAIALCRKYKIKTISFNIIGHPLETIETIKETIEFNKKIKVDDFKTQFMTPFPGTELYQDADKLGKFDKSWEKMVVFSDPIFIPNGLTKEDLIKWNKKGFISFYTQPRIIYNYLAQIHSSKEIKMICSGAITIVTWKIIEKVRQFIDKMRSFISTSTPPLSSGTEGKLLEIKYL